MKLLEPLLETARKIDFGKSIGCRSDIEWIAKNLEERNVIET